MPTITTEVSDHALDKEAEELAKEIFEDIFDADKQRDPDEDPEDYRDEMEERAWEVADGHRWVIYTSHALMICATCNTDEGEEFVAEIGEKFSDLSDIATKIAFAELRARINREINELIEGYEPPEGEPEEEEE